MMEHSKIHVCIQEWNKLSDEIKAVDNMRENHDMSSMLSTSSSSSSSSPPEVENRVLSSFRIWFYEHYVSLCSTRFDIMMTETLFPNRYSPIYQTVPLLDLIHTDLVPSQFTEFQQNWYNHWDQLTQTKTRLIDPQLTRALCEFDYQILVLFSRYFQDKPNEYASLHDASSRSAHHSSASCQIDQLMCEMQSDDIDILCLQNVPKTAFLQLQQRVLSPFISNCSFALSDWRDGTIMWFRTSLFKDDDVHVCPSCPPRVHCIGNQHLLLMHIDGMTGDDDDNDKIDDKTAIQLALTHAREHECVEKGQPTTILVSSTSSTLSSLSSLSSSSSSQTFHESSLLWTRWVTEKHGLKWSLYIWNGSVPHIHVEEQQQQQQQQQQQSNKQISCNTSTTIHATLDFSKSAPHDSSALLLDLNTIWKCGPTMNTRKTDAPCLFTDVFMNTFAQYDIPIRVFHTSFLHRNEWLAFRKRIQVWMGRGPVWPQPAQLSNDQIQQIYDDWRLSSIDGHSVPTTMTMSHSTLLP